MRYPTVLILSACVMGSGPIVQADRGTLDCSHRSLAAAVQDAAEDEDLTIRFTGVCAGPIVIQTDGLALEGVGTAVIDGGGSADAVTVSGASRVSLTDFAVRNGVNGIVGVNGAHLKLTSITSQDNSGFGISLQAASSGEFVDVIATRNGVHGIDVQTGSAATVRGSLTSSDNRVFGINVNGSSITFAQATASATGNALGIQIATSASAFLSGANTVINADNNLSTGLTVVSGAHLVSFGGTINASGNPVAGVSVNSKAGLDLDAGSVLNSFNNGEGVLVQQNSVMTVFNIPQFSGIPGFSTVNAHDNVGNGVRVQRGGTLTVTNQARVLSNNNARTGFVADNGAGVTLVNSSISGNTIKDIQLTFGTRADLQTLTFGSYTCDATVLVRGTSGIVCPH
jgi:Right handed beta helix region